MTLALRTPTSTGISHRAMSSLLALRHALLARVGVLRPCLPPSRQTNLRVLAAQTWIYLVLALTLIVVLLETASGSPDQAFVDAINRVAKVETGIAVSLFLAQLLLARPFWRARPWAVAGFCLCIVALVYVILDWAVHAYVSASPERTRQQAVWCADYQAVMAQRDMPELQPTPLQTDNESLRKAWLPAVGWACLNAEGFNKIVAESMRAIRVNTAITELGGADRLHGHYQRAMDELHGTRYLPLLSNVNSLKAAMHDQADSAWDDASQHIQQTRQKLHELRTWARKSPTQWEMARDAVSRSDKAWAQWARWFFDHGIALSDVNRAVTSSQEVADTMLAKGVRQYARQQLGVELRADWQLYDEAGFKQAVYRRVAMEPKARELQSGLMSHGLLTQPGQFIPFVLRGQLSFKQFVAAPGVQAGLWRELAKGIQARSPQVAAHLPRSLHVPAGLAADRDFIDQLVLPLVTPYLDHRLDILMADAEAFADGAQYAEQGKAAVAKLVVLPFALVCSLLGVLANTVKLAWMGAKLRNVSDSTVGRREASSIRKSWWVKAAASLSLVGLIGGSVAVAASEQAPAQAAAQWADQTGAVMMRAAVLGQAAIHQVVGVGLAHPIAAK